MHLNIYSKCIVQNIYREKKTYIQWSDPWRHLIHWTICWTKQSEFINLQDFTTLQVVLIQVKNLCNWNTKCNAMHRSDRFTKVFQKNSFSLNAKHSTSHRCSFSSKIIKIIVCMLETVSIITLHIVMSTFPHMLTVSKGLASSLFNYSTFKILSELEICQLMH